MLLSLSLTSHSASVFSEFVLAREPPRPSSAPESYLSSAEKHQSKDQIGALDFFPPMPPPHTYFHDDVRLRRIPMCYFTRAENNMQPEDASKKDDPSAALDARVRTSRLVEQSLRSLLSATAPVDKNRRQTRAAEDLNIVNYQRPWHVAEESSGRSSTGAPARKKAKRWIIA
jgi:hypothetical protein